MGASGWHYFTPYQEDVEKALQLLRQEVFDTRSYAKGARSDFDSLSPEEKFALEGAQEAEEITHDGFDSIEELLEEAAEEGTHSILDILRTGTEHDFGVAWPASETMLNKLYGTEKPTHELITEKDFDLVDELEIQRWEAVYIIVYKDEKPSEIYFEGISGD